MKKTDKNDEDENFLIRLDFKIVKIDIKTKLQLTILFLVSLTVAIVLSKFILPIKAKLAESSLPQDIGWVLAAIATAILFAINLCLNFLSLIIFIRLVLPKKNKDAMSKRKKNLLKQKAKNKIKSYKLNNIEFGKLLQTYSTDSLNEGEIFYKKTENIYNKKFDALDVLYFFKTEKYNSFDYNVEFKNINQYEEMICSYLKGKGIENNFINCIFVFNHDNLNEDEKDFYCCFTGLWNAEMSKNKFVKNRSFNYCGIDKSNNIYFYKPLSGDGGTEADLGCLIIKELQLIEVKI